MCANCEDNSVVVPIGDPGDDGSPGNSFNGTNGIEEHVVYDSALNISYTVEDFLNSVPLDSSGNPDLTQFRTIGWMIFPGLNNLNNISPNKAFIIANVITDDPFRPSGPWLVKIRNSNDTIIVESTSISSGTKIIVDMGALSDIPSNLDVLTIEVFPTDTSNITSEIQINSLLLIQQ